MDPTPNPVLARGVYAALATPRRPNSIEADTAALLDYLDGISAAGIDGLVLFGSTGEFIHFEIAERMRVASLAIKRSHVPVLINASHSTLPGAVVIAGNARDAGASGLMLTPPYFYRYTDDQIFEFYEQFLNQVGVEIPIYLYNLPMFLNPISPSLAARLLETGAFAGIKDSSTDWSSVESLQLLRRRLSFQLLIGNETLYLRGRPGADGTISGVAAVLPELLVSLDRAILANDDTRTQKLHAYLTEFLVYVNRFPSTVAIKQAAALRGWTLNHAAVPLDEDTAADVIGFLAWFREWLANVLPQCDSPAS